MPNYWNIPGVPHKGWMLQDVVDIREEGQTESDTAYETCMMCGNEKIRYVHIVEHNDVERMFRVGCNCAEKMTEDYENPKSREAKLRSAASRRITWMNKDWKFSKNGNQFLNKEGHHLLIYRDKFSKKYKCAVDDIWGKKRFDSLSQAKAAIFNVMEIMKDRGDW